MALSTVLDISNDFNLSSSKNIDVSGWDSITIQLVTPSGAINFLTTNDSGAIQGVTDGNAFTAANFTAMQATNLATGVAATSGAATGLWRTNAFGRFLQLSGTSVTAAKILIYLSKIS